MDRSKKGQKAFVIGIGAFALVGIIAFIVGYGLKDGWDSVIAWFSSKWAGWVYAFLIVYALFMVMYFNWKRIAKVLGGKSDE